MKLRTIAGALIFLFMSVQANASAINILSETHQNGVVMGENTIIQTEASDIPVPAAIWLFGAALIGFVSISRKTKLS